MDSLAIQKAYRKIIARFIVGERELTVDASTGDTQITIKSTRRFCPGEKVAIIDQATYEAEVMVIDAVIDQRTLQFTTELIGDYEVTGNASTTAIIRKLIGAENGTEAFIQSIYLGDPEVISHYPAITIDMKSRNSEWLTIESTKETYNIDISVYVKAGDYGSQYELMHSYVNAIEQALFRSFYPLVDPYVTSTLTEDVDRNDILIRIDDSNTFECQGGWLWFENVDFLRWNQVRRYLGEGVYELIREVGQEFSAGDTVIAPRRHIFNTLPESTEFGTVNKGGGDGMIKAARIKVIAQEEVWRRVPYIDSLTF